MRGILSARHVFTPSIHLRLYSTLDASAIQRLKKPTRGGQNLSMRYRRLEQSLRGKEALQRDIIARESDAFSDLDSPTTQTGGTKRYFHGLEIPQQPKPPEADECCMSGCAVCVYDLYEESVAAYKESVAAFRSALTAAEVPEASWPDDVRAAGATGGGRGQKAVSLSAFEELERSLKTKKDGVSQ
ncbi:oxidoreductase-like protein [Mycena metata]|uniref:Oxidoreductase-like protein n=1 Tax=Mycena metata TaxID=1033252 RepID=A0AAD7JPV9_9AGAR|nr:oxidoreductase-like protein [Mycena metata]